MAENDKHKLQNNQVIKRKTRRSWYNLKRKQSYDPTTMKLRDDKTSITGTRYDLIQQQEEEQQHNKQPGDEEFQQQQQQQQQQFGKFSPFLGSVRKQINSVKKVIKTSHSSRNTYEIEKAASCTDISKSREQNTFLTPKLRNRRMCSVDSGISSMDDEETFQGKTNSGSVNSTTTADNRKACKSSFELLINDDKAVPTKYTNHQISQPSGSTPTTHNKKLLRVDNSLHNSLLFQLLSSPAPQYSEDLVDSNPDLSLDQDNDVLNQNLGSLSKLDLDVVGEIPSELFDSNSEVVPVDVYEDSSLNLFLNTTTAVFRDDGKDDNIIYADVTHNNNETNNNGELMRAKSMDKRDKNNKAGCNMKNREVVLLSGIESNTNSRLLKQQEETTANNTVMKSAKTSKGIATSINRPKYIYSVQSTNNSICDRALNDDTQHQQQRTRQLLTKQLSTGAAGIDLNNNNNDCVDNNSSSSADSKQNYRKMLGSSIVKKPYAVDDLYIPTSPLKTNIINNNNNNNNNKKIDVDNIFKKGFLNHHSSLNVQQKPVFNNNKNKLVYNNYKTKTTNITKPVPVNNEWNLQEEKDEGVGNHVSVDDIRAMVEGVLKRKLSDKVFNESLVTTWCKEVVNQIRDQIKLLTDAKRKVIASAYIGPKTGENSVHVAIKCQKQMNTDDFITVAFESDSLFVWVSLMMAKY